ncbi:hypothetical protein [Mesorhizobium sp. M0317]
MPLDRIDIAILEAFQKEAPDPVCLGRRPNDGLAKRMGDRAALL